MAEISVGTKIKGRIVTEILPNKRYRVREIYPIKGNRNEFVLHEIEKYEERKHFLVLNWEDKLFEIE